MIVFSHVIILQIGRHVGAHVNTYRLSLGKMVLCAIFGCGTRTVRDKGIYMERIPSVTTNQGEEIRNLSEER